MRSRFLHPFLTLAAVALFAAPALATPAVIVDTTAGGAVKDGTVNAGEYVGETSGIGAGFGDVIGASATLGVDADEFGEVYFGLTRGPGGLFNDVVIYLDTGIGGFTTTATFDDRIDGLRTAISGFGFNDARATLNFAPGFDADYAIAFFSGFAGLWQLQETGEHTFIADAGLVAASFDANDPFFELSVQLSDLGLVPGNSFDYVVTYLNGGDAFRSNEFHGVASGPADNIGQAEYSLADGDFITFTTFEPPVSGAENSWGAIKAQY